MYARKDNGILSNPRIIADYSVSLKRHIRCSRGIHIPAFQCVKGKCRYGIHLVIGIMHHELDACSNLTELPDYELIPAPRIKVCHMTLKFGIGNIGKITDDYIRVLKC